MISDYNQVHPATGTGHGILLLSSASRHIDYPIKATTEVRVWTCKALSAIFHCNKVSTSVRSSACVRCFGVLIVQDQVLPKAIKKKRMQAGRLRLLG